MKLYYAPGVCSLAPHVALKEAGLAFTLEKVDLAAKTTETGADFKAINPKGYVPALQLDDGTVLCEGVAIQLWIGSQAPKATLVPAFGTSEFFKVVEWLTFISTELHKTFGPLFNPNLKDDAKQVLKDRLCLRLDVANQMIGDGPYVMGKTFTAADCYLLTVLRWPEKVGLDLGRWPNLAKFRERLFQHPSVMAAMKAEGLLS